MTICNQVASGLGFCFAPKKCKVVAALEAVFLDCKLHNQRLLHSQSFVYLRVQVTVDDIDKKVHLQRMTTKAIKAAQLFKHLGFNKHAYSKATFCKIYTMFIRSHLQYALALITLAITTLKHLDSAQHLILCALRFALSSNQLWQDLNKIAL